ncbi:MAG: nucleotidyltransferase [Clostridiales Family XIII bacterium]|jgi:predicted nucleotidyltransferase|nr:nucleotidyltransferase [Clostridiales Family XIII bacterium]
MSISGGNNAAVGIIAEYNPFHKGHLHHLRQSRELTGAETVVAVMSGDFAQRGEPALLDKWKRAEAAVRNGVDLVVELPFLHACNSAEHFAMGGVKLLAAMGAVSFISFGSESGDMAALWEVAEILSRETEEFKRHLKEAADSGLSFPAARQAAVEKVAGGAAAGLLLNPNNILAIEYLKQIKRQGAALAPVTVKRRGAGYGEAAPEQGMAGAAAVRSLFLSERRDEALAYMPKEGRELYEGAAFARMEDFFSIVMYAARTKSAEEIGETLSASEGLEHRLKSALDVAGDMEGLIKAVKSRRYTETRVRRFLLHNAFGITKELFRRLSAPPSPGYFRVLALNGRGRALLRRVKGASAGAVVTNLSRGRPTSLEGAEMLALDVLAADLYNLALRRSFGGRSDYRARPYMLQ